MDPLLQFTIEKLEKGNASMEDVGRLVAANSIVFRETADGVKETDRKVVEIAKKQNEMAVKMDEVWTARQRSKYLVRSLALLIGISGTLITTAGLKSWERVQYVTSLDDAKIEIVVRPSLDRLRESQREFAHKIEVALEKKQDRK